VPALVEGEKNTIMKNGSFLILVFFLFFLSCEKDEQPRYSCDDDINEMVRSQYEELQNITYDEIIQYEVEEQKAIFRAQTPENKYALWVERFGRVLQLTWTQEEEDLIQLLSDSLKVSWYYDNLLPNQISERNDFLLSWFQSGINNVGLSFEMLHAIAARIDINVQSNNQNLMAPSDFSTYNGGSFRGSGSKKDCKCSQESDWCLSSALECLSYDCSTANHGCGTVWVYNCDGYCQ
jgi:hypothetical protein